ncbi:MAG TPA: neutral zinc metallopeptidase [Egibacteraceae bacterium]|nr:neutral zinc metallopeptidase [Egibacteraceae bacterium]
MRFNRRARLDTSNVRDRRGGGRGVAVGGGIGTLLLVIIALAAGVDPTALLDQGGQAAGPPPGGGLEQCQTGADIAENPECRFVAIENSVQDYWEADLGGRGDPYSPATFTTFSGGVSTACGTASSQVGPFYCPGDQGIYLDIGFFQQLQNQLGAQGGDFAEAYVIAHEYGHHVQNLTGQMERVQTRQGPESDAVRLELQADCYAGVWAHHATATRSDGGQPVISEITPEDIAEGIDAAERIGDDYIQERFQGSVTPETWTHGSSEQRRRWFETGMETGDPLQCDTFSAETL